MVVDCVTIIAFMETDLSVNFGRSDVSASAGFFVAYLVCELSKYHKLTTTIVTHYCYIVNRQFSGIDTFMEVCYNVY